ncbi:hypothetical protein Ancab_002417 [Ancistrocladus abbreviatus]
MGWGCLWWFGKDAGSGDSRICLLEILLKPMLEGDFCWRLGLVLIDYPLMLLLTGLKLGWSVQRLW